MVNIPHWRKVRVLWRKGSCSATERGLAALARRSTVDRIQMTLRKDLNVPVAEYSYSSFGWNRRNIGTYDTLERAYYK